MNGNGWGGGIFDRNKMGITGNSCMKPKSQRHELDGNDSAVVRRTRLELGFKKCGKRRGQEVIGRCSFFVQVSSVQYPESRSPRILIRSSFQFAVGWVVQYNSMGVRILRDIVEKKSQGR